MNLANIKILKNSKNRGFGLVEIMISLIIVGSIISIVLWKSMSAMASANETKTTELVSNIILTAQTFGGSYNADLEKEIARSLSSEFQNGDKIKTPFSSSEIKIEDKKDDAGGISEANRTGYNLTITSIPEKSCKKITASLHQSGGFLGMKINADDITDKLDTTKCKKSNNILMQM